MGLAGNSHFLSFLPLLDQLEKLEEGSRDLYFSFS